MMKFKSILAKLAPRNDRLQHFFYGFFLFKFGCLVVTDLTALAIVFVIAVAIEVNDLETSGFDVIDILFTILTGLILVIW